MRLLLFMLFTVLAPSAAFAAAPDAGQIMVGAGDILRGHFTEQRHLKGFNGPMNSRGHFVVAPKYGLIWGMEKPFPTTTVITPAGLAQSVNGVSIMHLPAQKMPFLLHLYNMLGGALAGNWKELETDFTVVRSEDGEGWQVILVPRRTDNPAMPFSSITVSGHRFVENVVLLKSDGDSDTLTFLNEVISSSPLTAAESLVFNSVGP